VSVFLSVSACICFSVCVCVYVCVCVCVNIYTYTYICRYTYTYIPIYLLATCCHIMRSEISMRGFTQHYDILFGVVALMDFMLQCATVFCSVLQWQR